MEIKFLLAVAILLTTSAVSAYSFHMAPVGAESAAMEKGYNGYTYTGHSSEEARYYNYGVDNRRESERMHADTERETPGMGFIPTLVIISIVFLISNKKAS